MEQPKQTPNAADVQQIENQEIRTDMLPVETEQPVYNNASAFDQKRREGRRRPVVAILMLTLGLVLGAAGALAVYILYVAPKAQPTTAPVVATQIADVKVSAKTIVDLAQPKIAGTVTTVAPLAPAYKVANTAYYVMPSDADARTAVSHKSMPSTQSNLSYEAVAKLLESKDFKAKDVPQSVKDAKYTLYSHSDVLCALSMAPIGEQKAPQSVTSAAAMPMSEVAIACHDVEQYSALAAKVKPFAEAYTKSVATTANNSVLFIGEPRVAVAKTPGYQRAELAVGTLSDTELSRGATALFYQANDAAWRYVSSTRLAMSCDVVAATAELKKVYAGERCTAKDGKESTVTP